MRIHVRHETTYRYETPARSVIQVLRKTPRNYDGQHVIEWRIDVDADCRLIRGEDAFGNITHTFTAQGQVEKLVVLIEGTVETFDNAGVVSGTFERFPPELYLRTTSLTEPDEGIRKLAERMSAAYPEAVERLHGLMTQIHQTMSFDDDSTHAATSAAQAWSQRRGVCQDFAHVFVSAARCMDIPARYVGGYYLHTDGVTDQAAGHAWAEAWAPDLGWVGFDPSHRVCVHESHVRVASGLDYLGAAPIRGAQLGGSEELMDVAVEVRQAGRHTAG